MLAALHTVSAVTLQAVFTPAVHVAVAAHVVHGDVPDADQVVPATHAVALPHAMAAPMECTMYRRIRGGAIHPTLSCADRPAILSLC